MTQVTIRKVDEAWVAKAKLEAARKGVSMNQILVEAIGKGLGVLPAEQKNGLERFTGDTPEGFGPGFEEAMAECSQIHAEDWE